MKFEKNDKYFSIGVYVFLTALAILSASEVILHLDRVYQIFCFLLSVGYLLFEPLIIGLVIAYLMDPLVDFYERKCPFNLFSKRYHRSQPHKQQQRWPMRTVPTLFAFITLLAALGLLLMLIIMNIRQVAGSFSIYELKTNLQNYWEQFEAIFNEWAKIGEVFGLYSGRPLAFHHLQRYLRGYMTQFYTAILNGLSLFGLHTMNWLLAFVIAFYLLQDSRRLWAVWKRLTFKISGSHYRSLVHLTKQIDHVFSEYIRGEILDSIIITFLTSGALTVIHLKFAVIIGIISGVFNLIPYFGPIVGFVLTVIVGLLDPQPVKAVYGGIAILIIQQIDGWLIVPKIVGECVKLHPVIVLLVILIGGNLFGLIGMLLAVPVTAVLRVILLYYLPDYS